MDVDTALLEIDETEHKIVGSEEYERHREEYQRTLEELHRIAAVDGNADPGTAVADLTRWINEYIRNETSLPSIGSVDQQASEILQQQGAEVPTESHLGPA